MSHSPARKGRFRPERRGDRRRSRVIPLLIVGLGVLLISGAILLAITGRGAARGYVPQFRGGPRLEVAQEVFDYGYVKLDTVIRTDFEIRNVGDETLRILRVPQVEVREGC